MIRTIISYRIGSMIRLKRSVLAALTLTGILAPMSAVNAQLKPADPIDYSKLAFYPDRWVAKKIDTTMTPWMGEHIAYLTITDAFDHKVMEEFVATLDKGWQTYLDFTGKAPRMHRNVDGKSPIAAVPGNGLTCGAGCGYVGSTGIEANYFYTSTYKNLQKNPKGVPHLYFYEMGRNFFTFKNRHSCFTTGFAVFMRYVCIDTLKIEDRDKRTRAVIEGAVDGFAKGEMGFLKNFTNAHGLTEKQNRLKTRPTDQPVMYASAMLKLWKELGDDWLKGFYRNVHTLPGAKAADKEGARVQSIGWYLAASVAAKKDLAPIFVDQWRLPLTKEEKEELKKVNWQEAELTAGALMSRLRKN